jgi:RNA polymerase sigma-70 factor (ECF subfamily)
MLEKLTDHQLIARYLKGDEKSFEVLVARYTPLMYRFVYGYTKNDQQAQDITQEVFLKVWRNAKNIDEKRNFKSWIYTIAKNTALDFLKKKKSIPFSEFENHEGKNYITEKLVEPLPLPDTIAIAREDKNNFLRAIEKLSDKYQVILLLYYYQYLNFREIAEVLKEPINTIKSRHRRGVVMLREIIKDAL